MLPMYVTLFKLEVVREVHRADFLTSLFLTNHIDIDDIDDKIEKFQLNDGYYSLL